jgi:hypothetical protein
MVASMRRLAAILVLLAVVPAAQAAPEGMLSWKTHRSATVRVATPGSWIDFTRLTPQVLSAVRAKPELQVFVDAVRKTKALKLLVVDLGRNTVATGFATNLNVTQLPTVGDLRFQREASEVQLRELGLLVGPLQSQYVTLPAGRAVRFAYRGRFGPGGQIVSMVQFLFVSRGKVTVVTYATLPKLEGQYRGVFERSVRSFRFVT